MYLGVFLLGFILPGTPHFQDFVDYFLSHVREVFSYYFFKLGFGLVGRAMLSQPVIQLSIDGQGWASSLLLVQSEATNPVLHKDLCQGTLSRTAVASAPISMASNCLPYLHRKPSNIIRQVWFSLLWGYYSFSLDLDAHEILFVPPKSGVSFSLVLCKSHRSHWCLKTDSLGISSPFARSPCWQV